MFGQQFAVPQGLHKPELTRAASQVAPNALPIGIGQAARSPGSLAFLQSGKSDFLEATDPALNRALALAEEAFLCGTGQEIIPVTAIDRLPVGDGRVGPLTTRLMERYFEVVRGRTADHGQWRSLIV